jgi:hypothetical protein
MLYDVSSNVWCLAASIKLIQWKLWRTHIKRLQCDGTARTFFRVMSLSLSLLILSDKIIIVGFVLLNLYLFLFSVFFVQLPFFNIRYCLPVLDWRLLIALLVFSNFYYYNLAKNKGTIKNKAEIINLTKLETIRLYTVSCNDTELQSSQKLHHIQIRLGVQQTGIHQKKDNSRQWNDQTSWPYQIWDITFACENEI